jgi:hypothetical protein
MLCKKFKNACTIDERFERPWQPLKGISIKNRDAPDTGTVFAGYPANPKAGYRISG